jgi:hypothetical protein
MFFPCTRRWLEKLISSMPFAKSRIVVKCITDVSAGSTALGYAGVPLTLPHFLVDYVLDDCFQLISLLFLTVGRNNEAPAV